MTTLEQRLEALKSESIQIGNNYNEAKNVVVNCENRLREIKGGMKVLEELIQEREAELKVEPVEAQ